MQLAPTGWKCPAKSTFVKSLWLQIKYWINLWINGFLLLSLPSWPIRRYQSTEKSTVSLPKWKHYDNSLSKTRQNTPKHSWHPAQRHQATEVPLFIPIISQNRYMLLSAEIKLTFALIPSAAQPSSGPRVSQNKSVYLKVNYKDEPHIFQATL